MDRKESMKLVPILVGVGVVAASVIIAKLVLDQRKKQKKITLLNPTEKYPLKLVEKVVLSHDTRMFRYLETADRPHGRSWPAFRFSQLGSSRRECSRF